MISAPLLFGRRERDIQVYRELHTTDDPRPAVVGDVVRDRLFPLTIERVSGVDIGSRLVLFESGDRCPVKYFPLAYVHADGSNVTEVRA